MRKQERTRSARPGQNRQVIRLSFRGENRFLVPIVLETVLMGSRGYSKREGWRSQNMYVDLSSIEWVDFGAAGQLAVFIESALRAGLQVDVLFPLQREKNSERQYLSGSENVAELTRIQQARRDRTAAAQFLHHIGFASAIRPDHLSNKANIHLDTDPTEQQDEPGDDHNQRLQSTSLRDAERQYKYVFPLTWITSGTIETATYRDFLTRVMREKSRGLDAEDAAALTNVLIYELVDNVQEYHREKGAPALVGAWTRPADLPPDGTQQLPCMRSFVEWVAGIRAPMVEVFVGDSGPGIPTVLRTAYRARGNLASFFTPSRGEASEIIAWSFDRWSTSRDSGARRGTRGLYRVNRVVKKYSGCILVRSESEVVGWDHGGPSYDVLISRARRYSGFPGTCIRLSLPVQRTQRNAWRESVGGDTTLKIHHVPVGSLTRVGITHNGLRNLHSKLQETGERDPSCIVVNVAGGDRTGVYEALRQILDLRHPPALAVVGLPGGERFIMETIESLHDELSKEARDREIESPDNWEIWDPVLVIGSSGTPRWVGASTSFYDLLVRLLELGGYMDASEFNRCVEKGTRTKLLRQIRSDTHLIRMLPAHKLELRLTPGIILGSVESALRTHVQMDEKGVRALGPFLTPTLRSVAKWINAAEVISESTGAELAAAALVGLVRKNIPSNVNVDAICCDSSSATVHGAYIRDQFGARKVEAIPTGVGSELPRGLRLFDVGENVIIHTDFISSGQLSVRCIKQVLRDGAVPVGVTCFFCAMYPPLTQLEVWGISVPVYALASIPLASPASANVQAIHPLTGDIERDSHRSPDSYIFDSAQVSELLRRRDALYFSHIERGPGRHFTFYVNPFTVMEDPQIVEAFSRTVEQWIQQTGPDELEIWYPVSVRGVESPVTSLAKELGQRTNARRVREIVPNEPGEDLSGGQQSRFGELGIVILDWGSLAGVTLAQALTAASTRASRILAVILFSQLSREQERLFTSIHALAEKTGPAIKEPQLSLLGVEDDSHEPLRFIALREARVDVRFLARIGINSFAPHECPVCQQLLDVSRNDYPTAFLRHFAEEKKSKRLSNRHRAKVLNSPPAALEGWTLPEGEVAQMFAFKELLESALSSTRQRMEVFRLLERTTSRINAPQFYAILHFLSVETQWLRRPPLQFLAAREHLGTGALNVAIDATHSKKRRLHALMVLRASDKMRFARSFRDLFFANAGDDRLLGQLLHDAYTFLSRPYHRSEKMLDPLNASLKSVLEDLAEHPDLVPSVVSETIRELNAIGELHIAQAAVRFLSPQEAWTRLRRALRTVQGTPHHEVAKHLRQMHPMDFRESIETAITMRSQGDYGDFFGPAEQQFIRWLPEHWNVVAQFVDHQILPPFGRLTEIFQQEDAENAMSYDGWRFLLDLCHAGIPLRRLRLSRQVQEYRQYPERILERTNWAELDQMIELLRFQIIGGAGASSSLVDFLESVPADLWLITRDVLDEKRELVANVRINEVDHLFGQQPERIFAPARLLKDILSELLENIVLHIAHPGAMQAIWLSYSVQDHEARLVIANSNSSPGKGRGQQIGLHRLRARLLPFGGQIITSTRPAQSGATFEVTVHLSLWREQS